MSTKGVMMAKTATTSLRVDPEVRSAAESISSSLGMTRTEAINLFPCASIIEGGAPLDACQPRYNAKTEEAMREARDIMSSKIPAESYDSVAALLTALDE